MDQNEINELKERREMLLRHLIEDYTEEVFEKNFGKGSFGQHELLDRTSIILDNLSDHVVDHPSCIMDEEIFIDANEILDRLCSLYQKIADKYPDKPAHHQPLSW